MGAAEPTWRVDAGRRGETISASERRSKLTEVVERDDGLLEMHENAVRCRTAQRKLRVPNVLVTDIDRVHKRHDCPLVERPLDHAGRGRTSAEWDVSALGPDQLLALWSALGVRVWRGRGIETRTDRGRCLDGAVAA